MTELSDISSYVYEMARLLSNILEMDVTICDEHLKVLGDWSVNPDDFFSIDYLRNDSVITTALKEKRIVSYGNAKEENPGCRACSQRFSCNAETIVAYPLMENGVVFGGIGIYSEEKRQKLKMQKDSEYIIEFIKKIADLIFNELKKEDARKQRITNMEKMSRIIETLDFAVVSIDAGNKILYYNQKFEELTGTTDLIGKRVENFFSGVVLTGKKERISNVFVKKKHHVVEYELTYSPIIVEGNYSGALMYFRDASDVLAKANRLISPVKRGEFDQLIGSSEKMEKLKKDARNFARSTSNVLITGESGTGKELLAYAIHRASRCAKGPFVAVNCAAIPDNLMESELFGYEEGAFTGAIKGGRAGKFEIANHGTLFLDEIGELPIHMQPKLLRAIQEKKIQRVGSTRTIDVNFRIIAATNRDLDKMMSTGEFREDLFYRLNVIPLKVPPLRNRKEDIREVAGYFLKMYKEMLGKNDISGFTESVYKMMEQYSWPGNVRELQNAVEYAVNRCEGSIILPDCLPEKISQNPVAGAKEPIPLRELEKAAYENALAYYKDAPDCKEKIAKAMGVSRATAYRKVKEYGLE